MMDADWEEALYDGVSVDFRFPDGTCLTRGDLNVLLRSDAPCACPGSAHYDLRPLVDLGFERVDDHVALRSDEGDDGDDVIIWVYALTREGTSYHPPAPFEDGPVDGLRLHFTVLTQPVRRTAFFLAVVQRFADVLKLPGVYPLRETSLGLPADLTLVRQDIGAIVQHWRDEGIDVGSPEALEVDR